MAQFIAKSGPQLRIARKYASSARVCLFQCRRQFSASPPREASAAAAMQVKKAQAANRRPSMMTQQANNQKNIRKEDLPDDFGLLGKSFLLAPMPWKTWIEDPKLRVALLSEYLKHWAKDWLSFTMVQFKRYYYNDIPAAQRPKGGMKLDTFALGRIAKDLHRRSYEAISHANETGDTRAIRETCGTALSEEYLRRVQTATNRRQIIKWELTKYGFPAASVVSRKMAQIPMQMEGLPVGQQLAVVRINSTQKLTLGTIVGKGKGNTKDIDWGKPKIRSLVEHIVISRKLIGGVWDPWKVMSFTTPKVRTRQALEEFRDAQFAAPKQTQLEG